MNKNSLNDDVDRVCELVKDRRQSGRRAIIGIAGPPASGKSTLAEAVVKELNRATDSSIARAALLPMDGYHLDNPLLQSSGLMNRKGAPETFNADGFCDAIKCLEKTNRDFYFPRFDRQLDLAIANAVLIRSDTPIIIAEGNYLLLKRQPWASLAEVFTATVFVCPTIELLQQRLIQRWIDHGLDPHAAMQRATNNDLVNAELVIRESYGADLTLDQTWA